MVYTVFSSLPNATTALVPSSSSTVAPSPASVAVRRYHGRSTGADGLLEAANSNFGRALGITRRIAKRLPTEPPVLELDVTDESHLANLADAVREHVDGLDGVVHSIAYGNPETLLGGKFLTGPWPDVARAA